MLLVTDLDSEVCSLKADAEPIETLSATMRPFKKEDPTSIESLNDLNSEVCSVKPEADPTEATNVKACPLKNEDE
jgi:hypothetical protein